MKVYKSRIPFLMENITRIDVAETLLQSFILHHTEVVAAVPVWIMPMSTLRARILKHNSLETFEQAVTPFERMQHCRDSLSYLDTCGWKRSYHQRLFHEDFLVFSYQPFPIYYPLICKSGFFGLDILPKTVVYIIILQFCYTIKYFYVIVCQCV